MAETRVETGQSAINAVVGHLWQFVRVGCYGASDLGFETGFERRCAGRTPLYCTTLKDSRMVDFQAGERRRGCGAPLRRFTTSGNAGRFKGFQDS